MSEGVVGEERVKDDEVGLVEDAGRCLLSEGWVGGYMGEREMRCG